MSPEDVKKIFGTPCIIHDAKKGFHFPRTQVDLEYIYTLAINSNTSLIIRFTNNKIYDVLIDIETHPKNAGQGLYKLPLSEIKPESDDESPIIEDTGTMQEDDQGIVDFGKE